MRIYFARHGESQANLLHTISNRQLPHRLTQKGREQAEALSNHLRAHRITHIYTSPVPRAVETSDIVAKRLGLDYVVVDSLREYDCGILEGRSDKAAWKIWQEYYDMWAIHNQYDMHIESGESFHDVYQRFLPFIHDLVSSYMDNEYRILCISHGGIYSLMLPILLKNVDRSLMERYGFEYASCVVAEFQEGGLVCIEWNGHPI